MELAQKKVGGIVAENFKTAQIFTKYGIDFCCKGGISLEEACNRQGVDVHGIIKELDQAVGSPDSTHYQNMNLGALIDHIINTHHNYVEKTVPALRIYLDKLEKVHGGRHPELIEIKKLFFETADALTIHMKKEEFILFPYIKAMEEANLKSFSLSQPHFGHIDNPIHMMEEEHDAEGERFRKIAGLSDNYTPPSDGCQTYRVAFALLKEFEEDLHTHIHLENNILFPKAKDIYQKTIS